MAYARPQFSTTKFGKISELKFGPCLGQTSSLARLWPSLAQTLSFLRGCLLVRVIKTFRPTLTVRTESGQVKGSDLTTSGLNKGNPLRHPRAPSLPEGSILAKILDSVGSAPAEYRAILYSFAAQYANESMDGTTDSSATLELSKLLEQAEISPPAFQGTFYKFAVQFATGQLQK